MTTAPVAPPARRRTPGRRIVPPLLLPLLTAVVVAASTPLAASEPGTGSADRSSRIVNGVVTADHPTVVALLSGDYTLPAAPVTLCSGTLIGCRTVLTAAHCVCNGDGDDCQPGGTGLADPDLLQIFGSSLGFYSVDSIDVPSHYQFGVAGDVALLHLGPRLGDPPRPDVPDTVLEVNGVEPSRINTHASPALGTAGTIVGYGITQGGSQDSGIKRRGRVTVAPCTQVSEPTHVCWSFDSPLGPPGQDSNSCSGDSGGPLFVDFGSGPVVAGVTSGGAMANCLPTDNAFDADVFVERQWILAQGGSDLERTSCGDLDPVQSGNTTVHSWTAVLDDQNPVLLRSFEVPEGATRLRVTLNGDESGYPSYDDFDPDLRVSYAVVPGLSQDCYPFRIGPWESCQHGYQKGTWYVEVSRFAGGSGEIQLTATVFGAPDPKIFADDFESGDISAWE